MKISIAVFFVIALTIVRSNNVYAYIDPGTGSMVVQAILAVVAAVSVSIGIFWRRVQLIFKRLFGRTNNEKI